MVFEETKLANVFLLLFRAAFLGRTCTSLFPQVRDGGLASELVNEANLLLGQGLC